MPFYSVAISTLLVFLLGYMMLMGALAKSPFWMLCAIIYWVILVASGWIYVFTGRRVAAWVHALLMVGAAIGFGYCGIGAITFNSDARGPGASPLGGVVIAVGFLILIVAVGLAICGFGVILHALREDDDSKPAA